MNDDRDIEQLNEFRAGLAEPAPERQARMRARIVHNAGSSPPTRRFANRRVLVPAIAAASVLAVAVGAGIIAFNHDDEPVNAIPIGTSPSTRPSTQEQPVPATPSAETEKTSSTPEPPSAADHQKAVTLLEQFAATGPAPLVVPEGKLLYVRGESKTSPTMRHEMWLDVKGSIPVMIRRTDEGRGSFTVPDANNPKDNHEQEVAQRRADLAANGPNLMQPTPEFLAALPTDPNAMLEKLKATAVQSGGPWSPDHAIMDFARGLLYNNEPLLTPQVRSALYRALAKLDSISSTGEVIELDGRKVYAISQAERGGRQELLIDAQTGRFVGSRSTDFYDLWSYAVVATAGATS
jgi:hypothetical protein